MKLDTGLVYHTPVGFFVGGGAGISRFDLEQPYALVRAGSPLTVVGIALRWEISGELHDRNVAEGMSVGLGVEVLILSFF